MKNYILVKKSSILPKSLKKIIKSGLVLMILFSNTSLSAITLESVANLKKDKANVKYQKVHDSQQLHFIKFPIASSPNLIFADPELPETFILTIKNGQAFSDCGHIIFKNQIVKELIWPWGSLKRNPELLDITQLGSPKKISGKVAVIAQEGYSNYYHWITEVLPKIALLEEKQVDYDWLYVPKLTRPSMRETLEKIGVDTHKLIEANTDTYIEADELIIPSFVSRSCYSPRWVVDFLREHLADIKPSLIEDNNKNSLRIYISRAKARRKITNEDELFSLLEAEGFVKYHLEDLKVAEQIQLFKQAEVIVAAHGAGLTNSIFCKPKTKIFEIFQELEDSTFFYLSQIVGLQHQ